MEAKHKRIGVACVGCRTAKSKCDGVPPNMDSGTGDDQQMFERTPPCSRCSLHHFPCLWKPPHRPGRPRKGLQPASASECPPNVSVLPPLSPNLALQETLELNNFFHFDLMCTNVISELSPPLLSSSSTTSSTPLSGIEQLQGLSERVRPDAPAFEAMFPGDPSLGLGLRRFFTSFALAIPVLGLSRDYYRSISSSEVTLAACTAAAIGHSMYTTSLNSLVNQSLERALSTQAVNALDQTAGHLLLAYLYYGRNELQLASAQL